MGIIYDQTLHTASKLWNPIKNAFVYINDALIYRLLHVQTSSLEREMAKTTKSFKQKVKDHVKMQTWK